MTKKKDSAEKAMLLQYRSHDSPGFDGKAVLLIAGKRLYVVNTILWRDADKATQARNLAARDKLLNSIKIQS